MTKSGWVLATALLAVAASGTARAQDAVEASVAGALAENDRAANAARLARAINPIENHVNAINAPGYRTAATRNLIASSAALAQLEDQYPGIVSHVFGTIMPRLVDALTDAYPELVDIIASRLAAAMTSDEMLEAAEFHESDAGRAYLAAVTNRLQLAVAGRGLESQERFRERVEATTVSMMPEVADALTDQQLGEVAAFYGSPVGQKLGQAVQGIDELGREWSSRVIASAMSSLMPVIQRELMAYASQRGAR